MKKWYIIIINPGFETYVVKEIKKSLYLKNYISKIIIPKEKISKLKINPGYIILKCELDYKSWSVIKSIKGVASKTPTKTEKDVVIGVIKSIKKQNNISKKEHLDFKVNERIKIKSGPFNGSFGEIQEIDSYKNSVSVLLKLFNRPTFVSISKDHIEKE